MAKQEKDPIIYIDRPPRIQPEIPFKEIDIPQPPDREADRWMQLLQLALPLVMIVGTIMLAFTGGGGALMIIPMSLSIVGSLAVSAYSFRMEQKKRAEAEKRYNQRLIDLNKEMHSYHDLQRRFYTYNYPDTVQVYQFVQNARREAEKGERTLRSDARLWERRVSDKDFGAVRLGMGTLPSTVIYKLSNADNYDDPLTRAAMKLAEDSLFVHDIPVVISLRQIAKKPGEEESAIKDAASPPMPFSHALGIAGEKANVYEFVRAFAMHYCVFHQASDARLYILGTAKAQWEWAAELPHCAADQQGEYLCFTDEIQPEDEENIFDDIDGDAYDQFLEGLRKILSQRKIRMSERDEQEKEAKNSPTLPHLLVVVDLLESFFPSGSRLSKLEEDAAISILLEEGAMLGSTVVFLVPERAKVPSRCTAVVEIESTTPASNSKMQQFQRLHFRFADTGVNTTRYVGEADAYEQPERVVSMAQRLAQIQVRQGFGASIPSAVMFFDLMGLNGMGHLLESSIQNWQRSTESKNANWMRAKIGMMSGQKPRTMVFSAKRDGVHGMVAGSTGSGKSELLISLIAAMCVTYDPSVLNFVLVDFKGGGAFKGFDELPHCVDIITNLQGDAVTRMFTAINAEIQRRQKLNVDTNTKNIVDYRKKNLHNELQPYPFLFIIIDEFAEMIAERPEYKAQLESITRVGRAQGVSLILAAQRPSGVTDQMRSNIKFRISLRVETSVESREMLRREDAAFLPSIPGRGYLQVGNDDIELIQVAYTGEKYIDTTRQRSNVIWPERWAKRGITYDPAIDQEPPELYRAIVLELEKLANEKNIPKQSAPWPSFLPQKLSLTDLLISSDPKRKTLTASRYLAQIDVMTLGHKAPTELTLNPGLVIWINGDEADDSWPETLNWEEYAMRPVVGIVDHPIAAKQLPLVIELQRGHVVMFGAAGWGKTSFLRTLVVSLAATHSPSHVWIYIIDMGGRSLGILNEFPQVGAVIIPDEVGFEERVEQLFRTLDEVIEKRKDLLTLSGQPDIYKYNQANPTNPEPAIVVAIDNILDFKETFDKGNDNIDGVMEKFITMARQSKQFAIHFVITAGKSGDLSTQLFSIFTERLALKLADPSEARSLVGAYVASEVPDIQGRGYVKIGPDALSFQVAQPLELREGENENKQLEHLAKTMVDYIQNRAGRTFRNPIGVESLPKSILFKQLLTREHGWELNDAFLQQLQTQTRLAWQQSREAAKAEWLQVTVGALPGNRVRTMNFRADRDGVHGMIAGGTGSGKSELLMTMIVGMALTYDPTILNFVLVDFKGGGAFTPFLDLPHCVDMVTNLNRSAVRRFFTAINAEMARRQRLNTETGTKHIVEYREKGYHLSHEPYPHLFIIIDEYAEMISSNPEYKSELESIARLGRAQGVNLLLAAQRPTGVTDQMRANIKYRICLRVEEVDTSREMLRRSDAAFLPSIPGRGYLQVGNEGVELIQTAYTGEEESNAGWIEMPDGRKPKFYDAVVWMSQQLIHEAGRKRPRTPWPTPLYSKMLLSDPLQKNYLNEDYLPLITLGRKVATLCLNPFLQEWLQGENCWQKVDWNAENGTAMRAIVGLVDDPANSCQLPLIVDFTRGNAVIFGDASTGKTTLLRTLIASLAATHSPAEFQVHIIDMGGQTLKLMRDLPHFGTIIMPDEQGFEEQVQQLWRQMNEEIDRRKRKFADAGISTLYDYNDQHPEDITPAILVMIDNFGEFIEAFGKDANPDDETNMLYQFIVLARQARSYGIHLLITVPRHNTLNNNLHSLFTERFVLRMADADDYHSVLGSRVPALDDIPGRGYVKYGRGEPLEFQVAVALATREVQNDQTQLLQEIPLLRQLAQQMLTVGAGSWNEERRPLRIGALARTASYREQVSKDYGFIKEQSFIGQLQEAMLRRWHDSTVADKADWLCVAIGLVSGNRTRELYLAAKADGVHGLIAGGTGSGKSELLTTLICGLALNYDPSILNLVLVDYKGGGAFKPFENLPHCVDIVTNLNKAAVQRMFVSINAEIRRRQELNARTGTKDIVDYRAKGLHKTVEGYAHLFIIIDEYAEMIDDNPDYKIELESITRVGRAQGINLLLASQRPKGVTDQMRANMKLRICLRVEELDTSREMLRRPDAALLPSIPGRGYLQVGNEGIELIQSGFTGEKQFDDRDAAALWPYRPKVAVEQGEPPRLFNAIVNLASELTGGAMAAKPWPGFLPMQISLQSPIRDAQHNRTFTLTNSVSDWLNAETERLWQGINWETVPMHAVVGLIDHPAEATQEALTLALNRSHLIVYGDSGTGKTSFLRTLLVSLATTHSPNEMHSYIIDLGGRNFRNLENLPHLAAIIYGDDETFEERLQRLMEKLTTMTSRRQQIFADAGANTLFDYNQANPDKALPAILVLIDNFTPLWETQEALLEGIVGPLLRKSLSVGISFVITANAPNNIPSRLAALFGEAITFRQSNFDRYMDIVGRGCVEIDYIPGRGYMKVGRVPLMFQMAQPVGFPVEGKDSRGEAEELRLLCANMQQHLTAGKCVWRNKPEPVQILPELVSLQRMLDEAGEVRPKRLEGVLGENERLQPAFIDLKRFGPHFAVCGPPLSGKSTVLYNWILSLALRYTPDQVAIVLIDLQNKFFDWGGTYRLENIPHVITAISEKEQLAALTENLKRECEILFNKQSTREIFVIIDNFDDFSEETEKDWDMVRELASMARRHGRDGLHFIIGGALEGTGNDLRRQVQASNFGVGLRTETAIDTLRVAKRPPGLKGKELPVGRGYIVKSGEATMIQVATPYELPGLQVEDEEERVSLALDAWLRRSIEQYPEQRAQWSGAISHDGVGEAGSNGAGGAAFDSETLQILDVLKRVAAWKAPKEEADADDGLGPTTIEGIYDEAPVDMTGWDHKRIMLKLIGDALERKTGMNYNTLYGSMPQEMLTIALEEFPPATGGEMGNNGAERNGTGD